MRLLIIDLMPLLYRGHFAMIRKPRMTSRHFNASALHFFVSTLFDLLSRPETTHAALVADAGRTFRHDLYPQYKAQRDKMPEDIASSVGPAREFAAAFGVPVLEADGFEADDVAGTLAAMADAAGSEAWIVSPDKDMAQLVTDCVKLVRPSRTPGEKEEIYDKKRVCEEWGLSEPRQMVDWLGMAGDSADNIPGFDGIGPKKASELLAKFGSLRAVIDHAAEIPGKTGERIAASAETALLSRRLAEIRSDVPLAVGLDDLLAKREIDAGALRPLLARFEFVTLGRRILGSEAEEREGAETAPGSPAPEENVAATVREVSSPDDLEALEAALSAARSFAFSAGDAGVEIADGPASAWFVPAAALGAPKPHAPPVQEDLFGGLETASPPVQGDLFGGLETAAAPAIDAKPALAAAFGDPAKTKLGYDLKTSLHALRRFGIEAEGTLEDSMLAQYVLDPTRRHPPDAALSEAEKCAKVFAGAPALVSRLAEAGATRAWREAENPLVRVLLDMEDAGVLVDAAALSRLSASLGAELAGLGSRIFDLVGEPFNIDSPKQLGDVLFGKLGLPGGAKTSSGRHSTAEEVLQNIAKAHPVVPLILDWRAVSKLKSTYVDKLPQCIRPSDGRVHTTFQQALTETGRLSSDNPNLQNIPVRTERGRPIRAAFVAAPGFSLVSADYSQVELRVMAALSGDEALCSAFARDEDIHAATAARVFGIDQSEVTREQRSRCKQVSFGIIYGISAFGLAQRLGMPRTDADALIKAWFAMHPGVKAWLDATVARARADGCVSTVLGRRRPLRDIASRNATLRAAAERMAVNTPVQGTAAEIAKLAMIRVHRALARRVPGARLILQIHDELLVEAPDSAVADVSRIVREEMEGALALPVPLKVDVGVGKNWLEAH